MGWWKIKDIETGRIDLFDKINHPSHLVNAIPGKHPKEWLYNGDDPADEMGLCIEKIIKLYEKEWGRKPYKRELRAVFNFCVNPLELEE